MAFYKVPLLLLLSASLFGEDIVWLGTGYRVDHFNWSIEGPNGNPDVLSELKWKNLQIAEVEGKAIFSLFGFGELRGNANYGKILSGKNTDEDYLQSGKEQLYSKSKNRAGKGEVFDLSLSLGTPKFSLTSCFYVVPTVGYAWMEQHLHLYDGVQTVDALFGQIGPINGLDSTYKTQWKTGFIGVDAFLTPTCNTRVFASVEFHSGRYDAKGHWNLRDDFIGDFTHQGNARGFSFTMQGDYAFFQESLPGVSLGLLFNLKSFRVTSGKDRTHFLEPIFNDDGELIGEQEAVGELKLHNVAFDSMSFLLTGSYEF